MTRHLLDVRPHPDGRHVVVWTIGDDGPSRREVPFRPRFWVTSHGLDLDAVEDALSCFAVADLDRVEATPGLADRPVEALRVEAPTTHLRRLAGLVDELGRHRRVDVWDSDVRATHQFLLDADLWPLAPLEPDRLEATGRRWSFEAPLPDLDRVHLDVQARVARSLVTPDDPVEAATLRSDGSTWRLDGDEATLLADLDARLADLDPDVVVTDGGDATWVRHLQTRADERDVDLRLGRDPDPREPLRGDRSFWSYGRVEHQPRVEVLRGRLHLDRSTSFFLHEAGFEGLLDLARLTSIPVQELARLGAGTAVTALQIDRAKREGRLVPAAKADAERFKTEAELVRTDRGGLTHDPIVGVFGPVLELDYASMYPNIMVHKNVSPETVGCGCCHPAMDDVDTVPQLGWHLCRDRGFVSRALEPLVTRRAELKQRIRDGDDDRGRLQQTCDAMKWLAVCSFGYQGFKNARFGRIECHESICAFGRKLLADAFEVAHDHGLEVVHAIVDSIYLVPDRVDADAVDVEALVQAIESRTGIPIDVEGWYRWIVFCPTRRSVDRPGEAPDVGALTRFFGVRTEAPTVASRAQAGQPEDTLAGGKLKVRGVEQRQRSTPPVVAEAQERVLEHLAGCGSPEAVCGAVPEALARVGDLVRDLEAGRVPVEDLTVTMKLTRDLDTYRVRTLASDAARVLDDEGKRVQPGEMVRFVVRSADGDRPHRRVCPIELAPPDRVDVGWYRGKVVHALTSLVLAMGWSRREVEAAVQGQIVGTI